VLFAIHWRYKEHAPVRYELEQDIVEPVFTPMNVKMGEKPMKTGEPITIVPIGGVEKDPYAHVIYNPEARGFARPRGKHLKVYPRWTGMEPKSFQDDGPVVTSTQGVPAGIVPMHDPNEKKIADTDYASKAIVWDSSNIYTKG